jgi:hypothetical protein
MSSSEKGAREFLNSNIYFDCYDFVAEKMRAYPNVQLVRGLLPDTLDAIDRRKIAYLSVDLDNAPSRRN